MAYLNDKLSLDDFNELLDGLSSPILAFNRDKVVVFANKSFLELCNKKTLKKDNVISSLFPENNFKELIKQTNEMSKGMLYELESNTLICNKYKLSISKSFCGNHGEIFICSFLSDFERITHEKDELLEYIKQTITLGTFTANYDANLTKKSIGNLNNLINRNANIKNSMKEIAKKICKILNASGCLIWMKSAEKKLVVCGQYGLVKTYVATGLLDIEIGRGLTGKYINYKDPVVINDLKDNRLLHHKKFPVEENVNCMISIPMVYEKENIGAINVFKKSNCSLTEVDNTIVKSYGTIAAKVLINVLLLEELKKVKEELESIIMRNLESPKRGFFKPLGAMINHEMKNILNIFKIQLDEIVNDSKIMNKLSNRKKNELKSLAVQVKASVKISKEMSEFFTYKEEDQLEDINIFKLINRATTFLATKINKADIELHTSGINENIFLHGNYMEMLMIIFNLLTNSIKAINKVYKHIHPKGNIYIIAKKDINNIYIEVEDDGCGISNKDINHVFKPGFSTNKNDTAKSSGIGLYGSKQIVEDEYGGNISIQSTVGKGTKVTIVIPIN